MLDSAGYGPFTITKSVIINAPQGVIGGISVFSGDGIAINAGTISSSSKNGLRRSPKAIYGIRDGRPTDQTIILDREWLARRRAVRWTEISDGITPPLC